MAPVASHKRTKKQEMSACRMILCFILGGFCAFNVCTGTSQLLLVEDTNVDEKSLINCFNQKHANGARCSYHSLNVESRDQSFQPYPDESEIEVRKKLHYSTHKLTTDFSNATHLSVNHFYGGWGNRVFQILHILSQHNPAFPGPCLGFGQQGLVFAHLVCQLSLCPLTTELSAFKHVGGVDNRTTWDHIFRTVAANHSGLRAYWDLDREAVSKVLGEKLLKVIDQICAIHVRFGDRFFRQETNKNYGDVRIPACRGLSQQECFEYAVQRIQQSCANDTIIYIATDVPMFVPYSVSALPNRQVMSASDSSSVASHTIESSATGQHMNDMQTFSLDDTATHFLVADWLMLALSKESHAIVESTFSKTAQLNFGLSNQSTKCKD